MMPLMRSDLVELGHSHIRRWEHILDVYRELGLAPVGANIDIGGYQVHTQLNEVLLKQIAITTAGTYTNAQSVADLQQVYDGLGSQLVVAGEPVEITALVAGLALAVLVLATVTSYAWLGRLP